MCMSTTYITPNPMADEIVPAGAAIAAAVHACNAVWHALSVVPGNKRVASELRDEWRWVEALIADRTPRNGGNVRAQPLKELTTLAEETRAFVEEYTGRSMCSRIAHAPADRAQLRQFADRLPVLQQRLGLGLQMDMAIALRERLAAADVEDLEAGIQELREPSNEAAAAAVTGEPPLDPTAVAAVMRDLVQELERLKLEAREAAQRQQAAFAQEVRPADVERGDPLDTSGATGQIYRGTYQGVIATRVALKCFLGCGEREAADVRREVGIQMAVNHPHVLKAFGAMTSKPAQLCVLLELAEGGSLYDMMRARPENPASPPEAARCALSVAKGVAHLHSRRVHHRNLKSANVLQCAGGVWKVADFGLARVKATARASASRRGGCSGGGGSAGTLPWMAPELMSEDSAATAMWDKVDAYALGCVLYELLAWRTPWQGEDDGFVVRRVLHKGRRPKMPADRAVNPRLEDLARLMRGLWAQDPMQRPAVDVRCALRLQRVMDRAGEAGNAGGKEALTPACADAVRGPEARGPPPQPGGAVSSEAELLAMDWGQLVAAVERAAGEAEGGAAEVALNAVA
eukprot:CAMPEP_0206063108 /NCGR_PEP_ID=MMETSP1466-20131121/58065_1 /ASSEMBLY_ACC=CAM_ASM_001126 /TAXON_ID=44452 /ORGANISM="Pavlova gyrans, Strain CCMP608" /LENGTH=574 /DNA_ID=CAMNT_0053438477 /DNA_START=146 /DNA_END=1866 /DNA_ORIENTATION=+